MKNLRISYTIFAPVLAVGCSLVLHSAHSQQAPSSVRRSNTTATTPSRRASATGWGAGGTAKTSGGGSTWTAGSGSFGNATQTGGVWKAGSSPSAGTGFDAGRGTTRSISPIESIAGEPSPSVPNISSVKPATGHSSTMALASQLSHTSSTPGRQSVSTGRRSLSSFHSSLSSGLHSFSSGRGSLSKGSGLGRGGSGLGRGTAGTMGQMGQKNQPGGSTIGRGQIEAPSDQGLLGKTRAPNRSPLARPGLPRLPGTTPPGTTLPGKKRLETLP
jgi:hypothetical protein